MGIFEPLGDMNAKLTTKRMGAVSNNINQEEEDLSIKNKVCEPVSTKNLNSGPICEERDMEIKGDSNITVIESI